MKRIMTKNELDKKIYTLNVKIEMEQNTVKKYKMYLDMDALREKYTKRMIKHGFVPNENDIDFYCENEYNTAVETIEAAKERIDEYMMAIVGYKQQAAKERHQKG